MEGEFTHTCTTFSALVHAPSLLPLPPWTLVVSAIACQRPLGAEKKTLWDAGPGADPFGELCLQERDGGRWQRDDQQILGGLPRAAVLWWQRVHRHGRKPLPGQPLLLAVSPA